MLPNVNASSLNLSIKSIDEMSYAGVWKLATSDPNSTFKKFKHSFITAGNSPDRNNGGTDSSNSTVSEHAIDNLCAFHKNIEASIKAKEVILKNSKIENIELCARSLILSEYKNRNDATINAVKQRIDEYYQLKNKKTV